MPSLAWPSLSFFFIIIFLLFIVISHQTQYFPLFNSNVNTNNRFLVVFRFPVPTSKGHFVFIGCHNMDSDVMMHRSMTEMDVYHFSIFPTG